MRDWTAVLGGLALVLLLALVLTLAVAWAVGASARARVYEARAAQALAVEEAAMSGAVASRWLIYVGVAVGVVILVIGSAFCLIAWLGKKASTVYPSNAGQYPIIVRRGFGWIAYHDPNRGLGPAAVYEVPTVIDQAARAVAALRAGEIPRLGRPAAEFPPTADDETMLQVAGQAQATQLMAAATRNGAVPDERVRAVVAGAIGGGRGRLALPEVEYLPPDSEDVQEFQKLLEAGDGG